MLSSCCRDTAAVSRSECVSYWRRSKVKEARRGQPDTDSCSGFAAIFFMRVTVTSSPWTAGGQRADEVADLGMTMQGRAAGAERHRWGTSVTSQGADSQRKMMKSIPNHVELLKNLLYGSELDKRPKH